MYVQVALFVFPEDPTSWTIFTTHIQQNPPSQTRSLSPHPQFVYNHSANVTAILHKTAHLNCQVKGVGNKTVKIKILQLPINMIVSG